ncbi:MAG: response regulator [Oscillospiraceae bacterium]|jgi:PleD family two-component response regulator|nr:response regulator [Oscillospiraceae bacterium]
MLNRLREVEKNENTEEDNNLNNKNRKNGIDDDDNNIGGKKTTKKENEHNDESTIKNTKSLDKPVILAIDDSPDILKTLHIILRNKYKVYTLPKPEKLSTMLSTIEPDLFLLDYKMPAISGLDLITIIRKHPKHKKTPIIFLTSDASRDIITSAVALGVCDYVVKPFKSDKLRAKIEKHLNI